jgi:hypothetical protein
MFFLRFTSDPSRDIERNYSLWFIYDGEEVERMREAGKELIYVEDIGEWATPHAGLSGHSLDAETIDEAIAEVEAGRWFADQSKDSWGIFEGKMCATQDTPEGDTFKAIECVYYRKSDSEFDSSL